MAASTLLGLTLLVLAVIDFREYRLPDYLTLPLLLGGLFFAPDELLDHCIGAILGYLIVIAVRAAYYWLRRREGIGLGDAKLLAAAGAWVSWDGLPSIVLIGSLTALLFVVARRTPLSTTDAVPFGSFLCLATWVIYLYGPLV